MRAVAANRFAGLQGKGALQDTRAVAFRPVAVSLSAKSAFVPAQRRCRQHDDAQFCVHTPNDHAALVPLEYRSCSVRQHTAAYVNVVIPALCILPLWLRFQQCLRR